MTAVGPRRRRGRAGRPDDRADSPARTAATPSSTCRRNHDQRRAGRSRDHGQPDQTIPAVIAKGRVREVAPQADPVTRTFEVKVGLTDPPAAMRLGATVTGRIETGCGAASSRSRPRP